MENETPEAIPLPDKTLKKVETKEEKKQNPEKVDNEVKQVSEFEKKDLFDPNNIAALIDKSKEERMKFRNKRMETAAEGKQAPLLIDCPWLYSNITDKK